MEREKLGSRLGFILLSAGCAIGIGNVWRFPYVAGNSGGGFFVFIYLFFLAIMGLPIMTMSQSEKCGMFLSSVGKTRTEVAFAWMACDGWELSVDDVLYNSFRMDAPLFLYGSKGWFFRQRF